MLSKEELLKPRYKVIAMYPTSHYKLGQIIKGNSYDDGVVFYEYLTYQNIFRKLEWWQERKIEDMPDYLRITQDFINQSSGYLNYIFKTEPGNLRSAFNGWSVNGNDVTGFDNIITSIMLPATEDEYLAQQNNTNAATPTNTNAAE